MNPQNGNTPAGRVLNEAIDLAIEGRSPYPNGSLFIDAEQISLDDAIQLGADEGRVVVVVSADGSVQILNPESAAR